jgi:ABC-type uncharacterized transport system involved in gliding motility auxiliary subunit
MFFKKKKVEHHAKKIDKLITWLIIWWAVASMIGLSKTDKWKEITQNVKGEGSKVAKKWYRLFWKAMVWVLKIFDKK